MTNELVTLILQENVTLRTGRAENTLAFFEAELDRLSGELDRLSQRIMQFKSENEKALPDSLEFRRNQQAVLQERLLQLEREETQLQDTRTRTVQIYEQTGQVASTEVPQTQEERDLAQLRRQLADSRAIYSATNPNIRLIETRIAALEKIVAEQQQSAAPLDAATSAGMTRARHQARRARRPAEIHRRRAGADRGAARPISTNSIQATPANELALAGLERDYANARQQYDAMVASRSQAAIGERLESRGARASASRWSSRRCRRPAPDQPNRVLIAGAGVAGGLGAGLAFVLLLELLNRSIRRPSELVEPARHRAFRDDPLYPHPERAALEAERAPDDADPDRGGDPDGVVSRPHLLSAARPPGAPLLRRDRLGPIFGARLARRTRHRLDLREAGRSLGAARKEK